MKWKKVKKKYFDNGKLLVMFGVLSIVLVIVLVFFSRSNFLKTQVLRQCDCDPGYSLVCAENGHTYTSVCEGACVGGNVKHLGECH